MRLETQVEAQTNFMGTIIDGLYKRSNSQYLARLVSNAGPQAMSHKINRSSDERYNVIFTGDSNEPIEVFDLQGNKKTVYYGTVNFDSMSLTPDNAKKNYLSSTLGPKQSIRAITVNDYTFVANTTQTVSMRSTTSPGNVADSVQVFTDLEDPDRPDDSIGDIIKVEGDDDSNFDNYYLEYTSENVYVETIKPGLKTTFNENTMPHALVRMPDGTFAFTTLSWAVRDVGDEESNTIPSFVGKEIKNIFFHRNRLGFLATQSVVMSRADDFFNFWNQTALEGLADDPIDTTVPGQSVANLHKTEAYRKAILLFSDQQQFQLHSGDEPLTPDTVKIDPTTTFETDDQSDTCTAGSSTFFISPKGQHSAMLEYTIQADTLIEDASDVSAHCPHYLPNGFTSVEACPALDMVVTHSDGDPNALYIYKYYWSGNKKAQSAWSRWDFGGTIYGFMILQATMYMIIQRGPEVFLEKVDLENNNTEGMDFRLGLDMLVKATAVPQGDGTSTLTIPYDGRGGINVINTLNGREMLNFTFGVGGTTIIINNYDGTDDFYVGIPFESRVQLSPWYIKNSKGTATLEGRLQLRKLSISFEDSGYFRVEVTPPGRPTMKSEWTNNIIGLAILGGTTLISDKESFMVLGDGSKTVIEIVNDSYLPSNIQAIEFKGAFTKKARIL
jgi:hypothetical protein